MIKLSLEELNRISVDEFKNSKKHPFCFVLDDIRSRNNVGTFFRTADAFRASSIFLCGITPVPPHRDIEKTAIGATESVDFHYVESATILIQKLKTEGWNIIVVEQTSNSTFLNDFMPKSNEKYAFVFGNEVFGVNEELIKLADCIVEIPQYGTKHSFNVAVSAGITTWDFITKTVLKSN